MRKRLELRKKQVAVSLTKRGATGLRARVILVLDASGSMSRLYDKGVVAGVVERMAAVAAQLDDDGRMQAFTFASNSARLPDLVLGDMPEWIRLHVRVGEMKGFGRRRNLAAGQIDMRTVGIQNEEQKVIADVRAWFGRILSLFPRWSCSFPMVVCTEIRRSKPSCVPRCRSRSSGSSSVSAELGSGGCSNVSIRCRIGMSTTSDSLRSTRLKRFPTTNYTICCCLNSRRGEGSTQARDPCLRTLLI